MDPMLRVTLVLFIVAYLLLLVVLFKTYHRAVQTRLELDELRQRTQPLWQYQQVEDAKALAETIKNASLDFAEQQRRAVRAELQSLRTQLDHQCESHLSEEERGVFR